MTDTTPEVKGFFLHLSQCDALFNLPPEQAMKVLKLCREYCAGGDIDLSDPVAACVFGMMRPSLDVSINRAAAGRRGGKTNASNENFASSKPKQDEANEGNENFASSKPKQSEICSPKNKNKNKNKKQEKEEKEIPANPRFAGFVREFQNAVAAKHGATAPKVTDSLIAAGCQAMEQAERIDGFSWDEIQDALLWAMDDDFWGNNVLSLAQIRKRGANDTSKLQKVLAAYQKHKATDARPFWDRPGVL